MTRMAGAVSARGYFGPWSSSRIEEVAEPELHGDGWVLVKTRLTGICGSDVKQAFLRGDRDNPLTAVISFPQVLGHETTGIVERAATGTRRVDVGQRVVLNPWLSCTPRGFGEPCRRCAAGDYQLCRGLDLSSLTTHRYQLEDYRGAFLDAHHRARTHAVKGGFEF